MKPWQLEHRSERTLKIAIINDYVSQAQAVLASAPDSIDAQQSAEHLLSQALAVRPNDPTFCSNSSLPKPYIQAVSDFTSSKWDSVIDQLEYVVGQQAGYASGTALQTLYDAYIARGSDYVASGEYSLALDDFQRSAVLAQQLSDSAPLSFEAQIMIGEAQGLLKPLPTGRANLPGCFEYDRLASSASLDYKAHSPIA